VLALFCVLGAAGSAAAQGASSFTDVPDRFRLEVGGFRIASDTEFQFSRDGNSSVVDFEQALDLPEASTRGYVEGYWRAGRRHLLGLSYSRLSREGPGITLDHEIHWGDQTFPIGANVHGRTSSDYLSGVYRFAVYRNDRFEIGPALGVGVLNLEAEIEAQGSQGRSGSTSTDLTQPTGSIGAYVYAWPAKRLLFRGDMRYIKVKPGDSEASVSDGRASLVYHPWRQWGIGAQYAYTRFRYDRGLLSSKLGGSLRYSGLQLVLGYAF
jgi:hypothetical protein